MKTAATLLALLLTAPLLGQQTVSTDEAYRRLQQRQAEKQAAAATQPAPEQIAALQAENNRLREIIADLQIQIDQLKQGQLPAATPAAATAAPYTPAPRYAPPSNVANAQPQNDSANNSDRPSNGEVQTGTTATGIPQYTGPRGGTYHYSKNGNKVYDKRK